MRDRIDVALKEAMKAQDKTRLSTLRLITAAIRDRDIANRSSGDSGEVPDSEIVQILSKMVKQREESIRAYEEGGRLELAEREQSEIDVIRDFLPRQLSDEEVEEAIAAVIKETGAASIRDMGAVMGKLKAQYAGQMDFSKVGAALKAALG